MPTVLCLDCGYRQRWSNKRGSRVKDDRCEQCGGSVRLLTPEEKAQVWRDYEERMRAEGRRK